MKVLYVDLEREWRGGQSQALLTVTGLRTSGHDAQLLAVGGCPLARRAESAEVPVHVVGASARRMVAAHLLRRLLAKQKFDLIHANEPHALTSVWLAGCHRNAAVVASRRVAYPLGRSLLARRRYENAQRVIAISRFVAKSVVDSGIPPEKVEIVYEGVDVPPMVTSEVRLQARQRWRVSEHETVFGCVGYLLPEKGQEYLVRAFPAVRAKFPGVRLLLAGDGPCRQKLEFLVRELMLQGAVIFAGFVEDVTQVYAALDVFMFPSLAEPLGTSLLAAMAWGLPVVAVASGGVTEYVQNDITGALVARPEPNLFSTAMMRMLSDPCLTTRLGKQARRKMEEEFSARHMVDCTIQVYQGLLKKGDGNETAP
jgi:glycosyltransferase involved in cell wall biosynthesis